MYFKFKPKSELEKFGTIVYGALVENFPQTFFVGGMVRDLLLGRKISDIDIATQAKPEEVANILRKYFIDLNLGFQNLGVILATDGKNTVSITTFRKDINGKTRYPKIKFVKTTKEDSNRRDFSINSLYLSPKNNKILDFHSGLKDLKNKKIKFIGNPKKRIQQDPLRILRALRFALILKFKFDRQSFLAIKNNFSLLNNLTQSRFEKELGKLHTKKQQTIFKNLVADKNLLDKYFKTS